ncbi:MAG: hypothetical protein QXQ02_02560 [Halobacteria archaeon]
MKKILLFFVSFLLVSQAFADYCPVEEQYTLKLKFVDADTGYLFDTGCYDGGVDPENPYDYFTVRLYDAQTLDLVAYGQPCNGRLTMTVPPGTYLMDMVFLKNQNWQYIVYNGAPNLTRASTITVKSNMTRSIKLTNKIPTITAVSPAVLVRGQEAVISGMNFGSTRGYISFNGYLTNSSTYILSWTDTEIHVKVPNYATTGDMQICPPYSGCSQAYCVVVTD